MYVASDVVEDAAEAPSDKKVKAGVSRKKKRKRKEAGIEETPEKVAGETDGKAAEADAGNDGDRELKVGDAPGGAVAEPRATNKKRRKKKADLPKGVDLLSRDVLRSGGLEEVPLDAWLSPDFESASLPDSLESVPTAWWWSEVIWASGVHLILSHEAPDSDRNKDADGGDEVEETGSKRGKVKQSSMYTKMKKKDDHRVLKCEGPQDAANSVMWQSGVEGWRSSLNVIWQEVSYWDTMSTYGIMMHELSWKMTTRLMEQNVWHASEGKLAGWQAALGKRCCSWRTNWRAHQGPRCSEVVQ
jgi:hypothetical protein